MQEHGGVEVRLSDVTRVVKKIIQVPADRLAQVLCPIMREILLSSGCHRCRAMIESGVEADMGYSARVWRRKK